MSQSRRHGWWVSWLPTSRVLILGSVSLAGAGCWPLVIGGDCKGGFRRLEVSCEHWGEGASCTGDPTPVPADSRFFVVADGPGPNGPRPALLARAGVDASSLVLLDAAGQPAPAELAASAGGHGCRNGVGFTLKPSASLAPGDYSLVLWLDRALWPSLEADARSTRDGRPALVRRFRVGAP